MASVMTVESYLPKVVKAIEDLQAARKQVSPDLLTPLVSDAPAVEQLHQLQQRQTAARLHIGSLKAALSLLRERRALLLYHITTSSSQADQEAYSMFEEKYGVDQHQADTETLLRTLQDTQEVDSEQFQTLRIHRLANSISEDDLMETTGIVTTPQRENRPHMDNATCLHNVDPQLDAVQRLEYLQLTPAQTAPSSQHLPIQLEKLTLPCFDGDITKFQQFWCAFELAVHNDPNIDPNMKYLYLMNLIKGDAQVVLQDLEPGRNNYHQLVQALKKRYDCPRRTRALLHQQLRDLPPATESASNMRNTWFRIQGILHALKRFEDLNRVLCIIDLVRTKFPLAIQERLNDVEFEKQADFDLRQVMSHLDNLISSKERFEQTCSRSSTYVLNRDTPQIRLSMSTHPRSSYDPAPCCFCDSPLHSSRGCNERMPVSARRKIVRLLGLCSKCLRKGHSQGDCDYRPCRECGAQHHRLLCRITGKEDCIRERHRSSSSSTSSDSSSERQPAAEGDHQAEESSDSEDPARDSRRSRDYSPDRHYQPREHRGHRSRLDATPRSDTQSPSRPARFAPVRESPHVSHSPERRRTSSPEDLPSSMGTSGRRCHRRRHREPKWVRKVTRTLSNSPH